MNSVQLTQIKVLSVDEANADCSRREFENCGNQFSYLFDCCKIIHYSQFYSPECHPDRRLVISCSRCKKMS